MFGGYWSAEYEGCVVRRQRMNDIATKSEHGHAHSRSSGFKDRCHLITGTALWRASEHPSDERLWLCVTDDIPFLHFEVGGTALATRARNVAVAPCTSLSPNMADTTAMPCAPPSWRHALILSSPAIPPMATTGITRPGVLVTSFKPSTPSSLVTTWSTMIWMYFDLVE